MNRVFDVYVLESKNYSYKLKITPEGEFQSFYEKEYIGIPSPIEQNKRHVYLLDLFLRDRDILPKRLGVLMRPRFYSLILVSPKSVISRPPEEKFDTGPVIKADTLRTRIDQQVDKGNLLSDLSSISKVCSSATLMETARALARFHKPKKIDFRARFGLAVEKPRSVGLRDY